MSVRKVPLGQLLKRPPRYGINAAAVPLRPRVATYIRITDIDDAGRFAPDPKVGVTDRGALNYRLTDGDLVFARTGASVGKSYLYNPRDGELVYAGFLIGVSPDPNQLSSRYLSLFVQTKEYWDWVLRTSVRSGQPGINGHEFASLEVPVPRIEVQREIGEIFADVDDLISSLERLIAKKQAIKQGMMQQLLTGRTRLPGFSEDWCRTTVGSLTSQHRRTIDPRRELNRQFQHFSLPGFDENREAVNEPGSQIDSIKFLVPANAVLVSKLNPRIPRVWAPKNIGESAIASTEFIVMTPVRGVNRQFLMWILRSDAVASRMKLLATGTTGSHARIHPRQVATLEVFVPGEAEQEAIAGFLGDADLQIELARNRLAKARDIKTGMIQKLLTGRVRLPVEGES